MSSLGKVEGEKETSRRRRDIRVLIAYYLLVYFYNVRGRN
jgi:hypothetical protein